MRPRWAFERAPLRRSRTPQSRPRRSLPILPIRRDPNHCQARRAPASPLAARTTREHGGHWRWHVLFAGMLMLLERLRHERRPLFAPLSPFSLPYPPPPLLFSLSLSLKRAPLPFCSLMALFAPLPPSPTPLLPFFFFNGKRFITRTLTHLPIKPMG